MNRQECTDLYHVLAGVYRPVPWTGRSVPTCTMNWQECTDLYHVLAGVCRPVPWTGRSVPTCTMNCHDCTALYRGLSGVYRLAGCKSLPGACLCTADTPAPEVLVQCTEGIRSASDRIAHIYWSILNWIQLIRDLKFTYIMRLARFHSSNKNYYVA